jgi:hypothetical protein
MEGIHQWIVSVAAAAVLTGLCQGLMPAGSVKRISNMTCGLLLFVVIVQPIVRANYPALLRALEDYYTSLGDYEDTMTEANAALVEDIIVQDTAAYIEDKAREAGVTCEAAVECREEGGLPVPDKVTIFGSLSQKEQQQLSAIVTEELGIDPALIAFTEQEGGA